MIDKFKELVDLYNKDFDKLLEIENKKELKEFLDILYENKIIKVNKNGSVKKQNFLKLYVGRLQKKEHFGFLLQEDEDIYISNVKKYFDRDIVIALEFKDSGRRKAAKIISLLEREDTYFLVKKNKKGKIVAYQKNVDKKIILKGIDIDKIALESVLSVKIEEIKEDNLICSFKKVISSLEDPDIDMKIILDKYKIDVDFNKEVEQEIEGIKEEINIKDFENRVNLKEQIFMTIDGSDSKDLDDAISLIKEGDKYRLFVSIADVSAYVKENTALDLEAKNRATSVYFIDRVVPMLPKKISNGICSLHPNVDRLTMTCEILLDKNANVEDIKIYNSVINSKYRLTYKEVNDILVYEDKETISKYNEIYSILKDMNNLAKKLNKKRIKRGSFNLEDTEAKFVISDDHKIIDIKPINRGDSEKLIEEFMILANESVTKYAMKRKMPFIYRIHGNPSTKKLQNLKNVLSFLSINVDLDYENLNPNDFKKILDATDDQIFKRILSKVIVRSMQKARYSEENIGHFGLASKNYTHFTSPIRRYPDLEVHRMLKKYIKNEDDVNVEKLKELTEHCSLKEVNSIKAEQEIEDKKKAEFMSRFIGQKFNGTISSIEDYGFFIELENTIRGLVRFNDLKEYKSNNLYQIDFFGDKKLLFGQEIEVIVIGVNLERGLVDFVPSNFLIYDKEEQKKKKKEYKKNKYSKNNSNKNKKDINNNYNKDRKKNKNNSKKRNQKRR